MLQLGFWKLVLFLDATALFLDVFSIHFVFAVLQNPSELHAKNLCPVCIWSNSLCAMRIRSGCPTATMPGKQFWTRVWWTLSFDCQDLSHETRDLVVMIVDFGTCLAVSTLGTLQLMSTFLPHRCSSGTCGKGKDIATQAGRRALPEDGMLRLPVGSYSETVPEKKRCSTIWCAPCAPS